jgi:heptosyltransferase-2
MATPVFDCLRQNYPEAYMIGIIRGYVKGVIEDNPWFNQLIESNDKTAAGLIHLVRKIRKLSPDTAIVFPNTFRSALIAWLGGAKSRYGYKRGGRSLLLSDGPKPRRDAKGIAPVPMVEYYAEICRYLNLPSPERTKPRLFLSDGLQQAADRLLNRHGIRSSDMLIGMNPGAKFGSSKCWPPEYFARLAELLVQKWDCKLILFVAPGEEEIAKSIEKSSRVPIVNTGPDGVDLALLKPLIKRCQLLITNDTGPRHYAVAFDLPLVVIMGPTDPRYTNANLENTIILRQELECAPCHQKTCPQDHECLTSISPDMVLRASEKVLLRTGSA